MDARRFPNRSTSVRQARRFVADQLSELGPDLVEAVTLMVSELATNCVRHADTAFTVSVQLETDRIRVAVSDDGRGSPQLRSPTPSEPYGRGLQIVSEFSDDWGFEVSADAGTSVWFSVLLETNTESRANTTSDRSGAPVGHHARPRSQRSARASVDHLLDGVGDTIDDQGHRAQARRSRPTERQRCRNVA
jgi:anti-sigma regulatory factor (Ser/Thr protein kinase)